MPLPEVWPPGFPFDPPADVDPNWTPPAGWTPGDYYLVENCDPIANGYCGDSATPPEAGSLDPVALLGAAFDQLNAVWTWLPLLFGVAFLALALTVGWRAVRTFAR